MASGEGTTSRYFQEKGVITYGGGFECVRKVRPGTELAAGVKVMHYSHSSFPERQRERQWMDATRVQRFEFTLCWGQGSEKAPVVPKS